jgi:hypothetical protein
MKYSNPNVTTADSNVTSTFFGSSLIEIYGNYITPLNGTTTMYLLQPPTQKITDGFIYTVVLNNSNNASVVTNITY